MMPYSLYVLANAVGVGRPRLGRPTRLPWSLYWVQRRRRIRGGEAGSGVPVVGRRGGTGERGKGGVATAEGRRAGR
jgi:hypothetical protein